ncbi:hypothetical protein I350_08028 [Cryptococcus amylolentus CBS 6273]|uniref:Nudix hydrolase domain-containing protein n=1 Tax=Cryptococcus amylolentus CBS 6273 TaxID=1296118 RepID=A0A1E3J857_9TREE|nr:hypothetical protein I350_08028 [Cryptococcus amylolentus CBS 6273]
MSSRSLLPVVLTADNFPNYALPPAPPPAPYVPFHLTLADFEHSVYPLGLLRLDVLLEMRKYNASLVEAGKDAIWGFVDDGKGDESGEWTRETKGVYFEEGVAKSGKEAVSRVMKECVEKWKADGLFPADGQAGWRNELYAIYASPQSSAFASTSGKPLDNVAFHLERAACALFGLATFGVHLTAYEIVNGEMKVWVPRRSKTKATWPGRLDNSVAGGITAGMTPFDTIIKECDEEASLPEDLVRKYIKNVGIATYFYVTEAGFLQPEVEYLYDLPLPPSDSAEYIRPAPHDDEVESFALLTIPELISALYGNDMKPNCGLVYVDFLIRHGYVTPENEPNFVEIGSRLRRKLGVGMPGLA